MRIITGDWRGRRLPKPERGVRPTPDRAKEALFSILFSRGVDYPQTRVLDLFAGCGSIGLEALSRGAAYVVFVDDSKRQLAAIDAFLKQAGGEARAKTLLAKLPQQLGLLERAADGGPFQIIFADPPFDAPMHPAVLLQDRLIDQILVPDGVVIWEQEAYQDEYEPILGWKVADKREYSRIRFWFFERA